jgi:hypothetical protein
MPAMVPIAIAAIRKRQPITSRRTGLRRCGRSVVMAGSVLTRFPDANRFPLRWKTLWSLLARGEGGTSNAVGVRLVRNPVHSRPDGMEVTSAISVNWKLNFSPAPPGRTCGSPGRRVEVLGYVAPHRETSGRNNLPPGPMRAERDSCLRGS